MTLLPVAVIGAGPVGLAAAAHLLERGETPVVFERAPQVGGNLQEWAHVRMFSPWEYTLDRASVDLLESCGWQSPPLDELPTGGDMVERYLIPFAELPVIRDVLRLNTSVIAISRRGIDKMKDAGREDAPFVLHVRDNATGDEELIEAKAVIDASGTWTNPNPIGSGGLLAPGEAKFADRIFYGIPDVLNAYRSRYEGKRVAVVGSGHSAINALLDLARLPDTQITWVLRKTPSATYGGGESDALPARGQLGVRIKTLVDSGALQIASSFRVLQLKSVDGAIQIIGETPRGESRLLVDEIVAATGSRPDLAMLRELRLSLDPALESVAALGPLIDPNIHSCGTVRPHGEAELRHPEPNFYTVGVKSYGRAPTFLLATGYEQVRSVVAGLVGDWEAARRVELHLPETGVCSSNGVGAECCGGGEAVVQVLPINAIPVSFGGLAVAAEPVAVSSCCGAEAQVSCCAVEAKAECCGATAESGTCGCA